MKRFIERHSGKVYDLVIVGGGITGAAVAYEAASRGYSVALVDKGDFGAATSAATSKLIHGGLRYLANFEFGLVRESLKERRVLENIAPNLVYPLPFLIPLYNTRDRNKWLLEQGMILYDLLSYDKAFTWDRAKRLPLHRLLSCERTLSLEPIVNPEGLTGSILYYDCSSLSPERLTLAFVRSAVKHGADVANYARVEDFIREPGGVAGVVVRDLLSGSTGEVRGKLTVNCGGPWADLLLDIARGKPGAEHIRRSEGIHLITRSLVSGHGVGGVTPSGRHCNVLPWRGHALIGTTDREYSGDPDKYRVTRERVEEFLREVNGAFPRMKPIQYSDLLFVYGGLRPLVEDQTVEVYKTSRKYEIYDNEKDGLRGLITVEGGKYTTSRNLAENVLRVIVRKFGARYRRSITDCAYLAGCDIPDLEKFLASARADFSDFAPATVDHLARIYGTELPGVLEIARSDRQYALALTADGEMPAQALFAIRHEMACTLTDILFRRTGIGTLGHPGKAALETIAMLAARELHWDQGRMDRELEAAEQALSLPN